MRNKKRERAGVYEIDVGAEVDLDAIVARVVELELRRDPSANANEVEARVRAALSKEDEKT